MDFSVFNSANFILKLTEILVITKLLREKIVMNLHIDFVRENFVNCSIVPYTCI